MTEGGLGAVGVAVKSGWLILHCVQNDKGGAWVLVFDQLVLSWVSGWEYGEDAAEDVPYLEPKICVL